MSNISKIKLIDGTIGDIKDGTIPPVAYIEDGSTASIGYKRGDCVLWNGRLCIVLPDDLPSGTVLSNSNLRDAHEKGIANAAIEVQYGEKFYISHPIVGAATQKTTIQFYIPLPKRCARAYSPAIYIGDNVKLYKYDGTQLTFQTADVHVTRSGEGVCVYINKFSNLVIGTVYSLVGSSFYILMNAPAE